MVQRQMLMAEVFEMVKQENARAKLLHGSWLNLPQKDRMDALISEFEEVVNAYVNKDINGPHGLIAETVQLANLCIRMVMAEYGDRDA